MNTDPKPLPDLVEEIYSDACRQSTGDSTVAFNTSALIAVYNAGRASTIDVERCVESILKLGAMPQSYDVRKALTSHLSPSTESEEVQRLRDALSEAGKVIEHHMLNRMANLFYLLKEVMPYQAKNANEAQASLYASYEKLKTLAALAPAQQQEGK